MGQVNYTYPWGKVGQVGTYATGDIVSIVNPLARQVTNYHQDGDTTDGTYTLSATDGRQTVTASFVAAGLTADQIAAGLAAAINADTSFRGVGSSGTVVGDTFDITFTQPGLVWTLTMTSDPSGGVVDLLTTTTAGYTQVAPGIVLQSDTAGGFTTTYTDAKLGLGVTIRNADLVQPMANPAGATGYDGPAEMSLVRRGEVYVQVVAGTTVYMGDRAYFDPTGATWDNAGAGSHVLVENAQWQTSGTGVQRVYVNFPSDV